MEVVSINVPEKSGAQKTSVPFLDLDFGDLQGELRIGNSSGLVSLIAEEDIQQVTADHRKKDDKLDGNIIVRGMDLRKVHPLDRFIIGNAELEVTRTEKDRIYARVLQLGSIKASDVIYYTPFIFDIQIITLSDRVSRGEYDDLSGPKIAELSSVFFKKLGWSCNIDITVIPDDATQLQLIISGFVGSGTDVIFTTGGTGIGPRDITVDVVKLMLDKEIPGIMELIRYKYGSQKPNALISRAVAGVIGGTLIYTLPGSVKAVDEYCSEIFPVLEHSILMLHGIDAH
jgi:molybdenum cofactor synthesis domain-containing protein